MRMVLRVCFSMEAVLLENENSTIKMAMAREFIYLVNEPDTWSMP